MQCCFCLVAPNLAFGLGAVGWLLLGHGAPHTLPFAVGEAHCYGHGVSSGDAALKPSGSTNYNFRGKNKVQEVICQLAWDLAPSAVLPWAA